MTTLLLAGCVGAAPAPEGSNASAERAAGTAAGAGAAAARGAHAAGDTAAARNALRDSLAATP